MDERDMQPRSGIPAKHVFFAFLLTVIVAVAGLVWIMVRAQKPASAVLAFDTDSAQHLDAGLMSARQPAVALADSILTDTVVAGLAKQAHLAASTPAAQMGEFRADLELTQPSAGELRVRFVDVAAAPWAAQLHAQSLGIGTEPSAETANAVARVLANWDPSHAAPAPATSAAAQPQSSPAVPAANRRARVNPQQSSSAVHSTAPAAAPAPAQAATAPHPVADGLAEVDGLLSSTDRDLNQLGGGAGRGYAGSSYTESRQQHLLNTQVSAAERRLDRLRAQGGSGEVKARVNDALEAVRSILGGGRHGFNGAGTSAVELRRERAALRHAIGVVGQDQQAVQRIESAQHRTAAGAAEPAQTPAAAAAPAGGPSAPSAASSPAAAPASGSATSASGSSTVQEQNLPAGSAANPAPFTGGSNPLTIIRLASPPQSPRLWIPIVAAGLCGLLYLGLAGLAYRHRESDEGYEESGSAYRFITPAAPIQMRSEPVRVEERPAPEPPREEPAPGRRASFALESNPVRRAVPRNVPQPEVTPVAVQEGPATKPQEPAATDEEAALSERLRKALADGSIGRVFEPSKPEAANKPPEGTQTNAGTSDRRVS